MDSQRMEQKTKEYFNGTAKNYDTSHDGRFVKCMYGEIVKWVGDLPGEKILDLGCGNGNVIRLLEQERQARYFGVDISEQMIAEAEKRVGSGAELRTADVVDLPFPDEMFDIIICNASFHHYTEPDRAVEEIKRTLKTGGMLVLGDPTIPGDLFRKWFNRSFSSGNSGDFWLYGKQEIISLFQKHGFLIRKWKRINFRSFLLCAEKNNTKIAYTNKKQICENDRN